LGIPVALLIIGILDGLLQVLFRAGIIQANEALGIEYYQGLTLHGVINALVFTTSFCRRIRQRARVVLFENETEHEDGLAVGYYHAHRYGDGGGSHSLGQGICTLYFLSSNAGPSGLLHRADARC